MNSAAAQKPRYTDDEISAAQLYISTMDAMYEDAYERSEFISENDYQRQLAICNYAFARNHPSESSTQP